jgi:hypothetical protein
LISSNHTEQRGAHPRPSACGSIARGILHTVPRRTGAGLRGARSASPPISIRLARTASANGPADRLAPACASPQSGLGTHCATRPGRARSANQRPSAALFAHPSPLMLKAAVVLPRMRKLPHFAFAQRRRPFVIGTSRRSPCLPRAAVCVTMCRMIETSHTDRNNHKRAGGAFPTRHMPLTHRAGKLHDRLCKLREACPMELNRVKYHRVMPARNHLGPGPPAAALAS